MKYLGQALVLFLLNLAAPALADGTVTYTYDALGRLINSTSSGTSTATTDYTLDPAGNRINVAVTGAGAGTPSFSINTVTVTEGGTATFTVTKSGTASGTLSVNFASANDTAVAGSDYNAVAPGTLTFLATDTTKTIDVTTIDDAAAETPETFTVTLSGNSAGSTIGTGTGTGTITDNDASFAISDAQAVTEGGTLVYTVTKSGGGAANVTYATANDTATAGSDYTAIGATVLNFAAGDVSKTISVSTIDDATAESPETVLINLSGATGGAAITDAQGSGQINDNDSVAPSFAISDAAVTEGGNLIYTVTKTGGGAANVTYATANGSATAGSDYTAISSTQLTFPAGDGTQTITVATIDDSTSELPETVLVNLSGATGGATIADAQGSGTINDNDASIAISDPTAVTEGGSLVYTVTKTGGGAVSVNYATADGTATAGSDYTAISSTQLNFAAGNDSKTVTVTTIDDATSELPETVLVNLSGATGGATIADAQGSGTINDNDASIAISDPTAVTEGGSLVYTVTKTGGGAVSVNYATANGTATAGSDYTAISSTQLNFAAGNDSKTITVTTIDDSTSELPETVLVNLSGATGGATIADAQGSGTINDNDASIAISDPTAVTEGGSLVYTVTKTGGGAVSVNYATANGTATAGSDYNAISSTQLNFAAGNDSKTVTVTTIDDAASELSETVLVNLSGATGGATIADAQGSGTINDNDLTSFAISDTSVAEGGDLVFTVTKTGSGAANVSYATTNGTATSGPDYSPTSGTLVFASGDTTKTITIDTVGDQNLEADETVLINLSGATGGAIISDAQGIGAINNDDIAFAISDPSPVTEGTSLIYTVTKTGGFAGSINYATSDSPSGGRATVGLDYTSASGTLVFAAGDTAKTVTIPTIDDSTVELPEILRVILSGQSGVTGGATISDGQGDGTINDNDATSFAISDASATEGGAVVYTVTKTGTAAANVSYATASGTATSGSDFTSASGTLVFASGDTTKTITVSTTEDAAVEAAETVLVNLSGPTGGTTISDAQGIGTINDNDTGFVVSNATAVTEGGTLVYTVTKTGSAVASVSYATAGGSATSGTDFTATSGTLNFASGQTSQTISVLTVDDSTIENGETVLMNLSGATGGATITDAQGTGTINDNDATSFAISDASVTEAGTLVFTVTKTGSGVASANYSSVSGTATSGPDFAGSSGTLTFTAGQTSQTVSVPTNDDHIIESNETMLVNLNVIAGDGATITDGQGVGTINDDDATSFAISDPLVTEGGNLVFIVTKTGSGGASVSYASASGTATSGNDFTATSGTLTFSWPTTSLTISVPTTNDQLHESNETVLMNLSGATGGATITDAQGNGTINDND